MPEGLDVTYDYLRREIGRATGLGRDPTTWESHEVNDVADILAGAMRRYYWPMPVGEGPRYVWSFLKRVQSLDLADGTNTYELPSDFGGSISGLMFPAGSAVRVAEQLMEEEIRSLYATRNLSGDPRNFAVRAKNVVGNSETRYEIMVYPTPARAVTISYRCLIIPPALSAANPIPLGGAQHSQTIIQACLADAEEKLNDVAGGVHEKRFMDCLQTSIQVDREQFQ